MVFLSYDNIIANYLSIFKERRSTWGDFFYGGRASLIDRYLVLFRMVLVRKQKRKTQEIIVLYTVKTRPRSHDACQLLLYWSCICNASLPVKMTQWRKQFRLAFYIWCNKLCSLCQNFLFFFSVCLFVCLWFIQFWVSLFGIVSVFLFLLSFPFRLQQCLLSVLNLQCHWVLLKISNALGEYVLYLFFLLVWTSLCLRSACLPVNVSFVKKP